MTTVGAAEHDLSEALTQLNDWASRVGPVAAALLSRLVDAADMDAVDAVSGPVKAATAALDATMADARQVAAWAARCRERAAAETPQRRRRLPVVPNPADLLVRAICRHRPALAGRTDALARLLAPIGACD